METGLGSKEDTILYYRSLTSVERVDPVNGRCVNHLCIWVRVFKTKFHHGRSCKGGEATAATATPLATSLLRCKLKGNVGRISRALCPDGVWSTTALDADPFSYPDLYVFHNLGAIVVFCSIKHRIKKPPSLPTWKKQDFIFIRPNINKCKQRVL